MPQAWGGNCFAPTAGCAQGLCVENGELLIAAVLLLVFVFGSHGWEPPCPPWEPAAKN